MKTKLKSPQSHRVGKGKPLVLIMMGSDSDAPQMEAAAAVLEEFAVPYSMVVASAHRSPARVHRLVSRSEKEGVKVVIAGAGGAAHLAGVVASRTTLPVIGVPLQTPALQGLDALLATVQMPAGVPVACTALGAGGARNAGLLALQILAVAKPRFRQSLRLYKRKLAAGVAIKQRALEARRVVDSAASSRRRK